MKKEEALTLLSFHSGRNLNDDNELNFEDGFLGSIRKFDSKLIKKNFINVMECLKVLSKEFEKDKIDRNLVADLYGIFYQSNLWLNNGKLKNLSKENRDMLNEMIKIYSYALTILFDYYGEESYEEAFSEYEDYLEGYSNYN